MYFSNKIHYLQLKLLCCSINYNKLNIVDEKNAIVRSMRVPL